MHFSMVMELFQQHLQEYYLILCQFCRLQDLIHNVVSLYLMLILSVTLVVKLSTYDKSYLTEKVTFVVFLNFIFHSVHTCVESSVAQPVEDSKSNDPCRAVVRSSVRADFFGPPVHPVVMGSWSL